MPDGFAFTEETARRVVAATRWVEGQRTIGPARRPRRPRPTYDRATDENVANVVVRVREWGSNARTILVAPVEADGDGWVRFERDDEGKVIHQTIFVHPGARRRFYAPFAQEPPEPPSSEETVRLSTRILKAYRWRDGWYLEQTLLFGFPLQDKAFRIEGCLPVIAT